MTIRSKLAPVTLLLAVLATRDAHAAPDCANPQDQRAMNECASRGYARADAELNRRYRALQRRLNGDRDGARKLTEAQRAWIAFRDTECAFQTIGVAGGGGRAAGTCSMSGGNDAVAIGGAATLSRLP